MKNNKGFTLVELLAVIVIMGILMMVAIPSVTRTIENSRKDSFVDIAKSYANAVRTLWTADGLSCEGIVSSAVDDGNYYILINSTESAKENLPKLLDQGGKSSWGNRDVNGYVRVNVSTTLGTDIDDDGIYEIEPKRVTKFYVALSDGTHGIIDDNTLTTDELKRGNINMNLIQEDLKKIELTFDENGRLNCNKITAGIYICNDVLPPTDITGVCIDETSSVGTMPFQVVEVNTFESLKSALENGQSVRLTDDITIAEKINISGQTIILGSNNSIKYNSTYTGTLFDIADDATLYISNLIIDGNNTWSLRPENITVDSTSPWYTKYVEANGVEVTDFVIKNKGELTLHNTTITNTVLNAGLSASYNNDLAVISSTEGTVVIDSCSISNNIGLALNTSNTSVELKNSTSISNNFSTGNKGGIIITGNQTITMDDGVHLDNNTTIVRSGAIIGLINNATLIMNGGTIDNNKVEAYGSNTSGSMICLESGSGMVMNGGSISNNVGVLAGAISSRWNSGSHGTSAGIFLNNGTITGNTTLKTSWNNSAVFLRSAATIGSNMVIDGNIESNSDGVLINNGTINGDVYVSAANAVVTNNNKINGNVNQTAATATFTNNGTVSGTIS